MPMVAFLVTTLVVLPAYLVFDAWEDARPGRQRLAKQRYLRRARRRSMRLASPPPPRFAWAAPRPLSPRLSRVINGSAIAISLGCLAALGAALISEFM